MDYSAEEYTEMLIFYGEAGRSASGAAALYAERYPERERHPSHHVILGCVQRARETGCLMPRHHGASVRIPVRDEERVLRHFEENPGNSVRRAVRDLGLSRYVVHRTLRRNGLHAYHYQRVQQLVAGDEEQRIYFCEGNFCCFYVIVALILK